MKSGTGTMTFSGGSRQHLHRRHHRQRRHAAAAKTAGVNAIAGGTVTVGDGAGGVNCRRAAARRQRSDWQRCRGHREYRSGLFDLYGFSETINIAGTCNGGSVTTGSGTLTLNSCLNSKLRCHNVDQSVVS